MKQQILFILAFLFFLHLNAQDDTLRMTLEEAKAYAKIHSRDMKQNQYEVDRARLIVKQATAALLPQVTGEASYTYYTKIPVSVIDGSSFSSLFPIPGVEFKDFELPLGQKNVFAAKISLFQTLFNGVYLIGLEGAKMFIDLNKAEKDVKDVEIVDNVIRSYYGALIARENVKIVSENISKLERLLYETTQIYKQGFAEQLDVDRLTLALASLRSQVDGLKAQALLAETNFKYQMGYPVDKPIALTGNADSIIASVQPLIDSADFSRRKELQLMNIREEINKVKVKKEKYQYLPVLNGFAALGSSGQRDKLSQVFTNKWQNYHYFGIQMQVTIWDNFAKKREWQQTQIDLEKIRLGREQMQEGFKLQYEKARIDFENAYRDVQVQKDNVSLAQKIYDVAQKKYKEGVGSSLEMTQAQMQYYTTQAQYLGTVYKALIAKTDIEKSLGTQ
jgi:outer membrane protein TolC